MGKIFMEPLQQIISWKGLFVYSTCVDIFYVILRHLADDMDISA